MSSSYTQSASETFTITHARHLAAKIATDLKRMQRLYGLPSDSSIEDYQTEAIELMRHGYLKEVTYGYKRDEMWIEPGLRYTAQELQTNGIDDDPGKIRPGLNVAGASFASFLVYSDQWEKATDMVKTTFKATLPFKRGSGDTPQVKNGYFEADKTYSAGGRSLNRATIRSYS